MNIEAILRCEDRYAECFCTVWEDAQILRFRDSLLPDMYDHNYIRIKTAGGDNEIASVVQREIAYSIAEGRKYCNIFVDGELDFPFLRALPVQPQETTYAFYAADDPAALSLRRHDGCVVEKIANEAMIAERLCVELAEYGEKSGEDFCRRKSERMKKVYLTPGGVDAYLCRCADAAVGACDLFVAGNIAKIEDFDVATPHQRKGYGTAILHKLVSDAVQMGAKTIYMVTDADDTAKEMYAKLGFVEVARKKQLFFTLA